MLGIELHDSQGRPAGAAAVRAVQRLLALGRIVLPEGEHGEVISFTPPLTLPEAEIPRIVARVHRVLDEGAADSTAPFSTPLAATPHPRRTRR
jgi:4-aminobutyrate aminotransferase-like enzyme